MVYFNSILHHPKIKILFDPSQTEIVDREIYLAHLSSSVCRKDFFDPENDPQDKSAKKIINRN